MNRDRNSILSIVAVIADVALVGLGFMIAYYEKRNLPGELASLARIQDYGWLFLLYLGLVIGALYLNGFYTFTRTQTIADIVLGITKSVVAAFAVIIFTLFVFREHSISRLFLGLFCLNNALVLIIWKILFRIIVSRFQEHGYNVINALIIGSEYPAKKLISNLQVNNNLGYRILGCLDPEKGRVGQKVGDLEVVGTTDQLEEFLDKWTIDEVFIAMPRFKLKDMNKIMYLCEEVGVRFSIMADWLKPNIAKMAVRDFIESPIITYYTTPTAVGQLLLKVIMDRALAAVLLVIISPILLVIALAIKVSSPGPVLFRQRRAGLNGRLFNMLKFRTMVQDAEKLRSELEDRNEMDGPVFKIKDDPRVTRLGRYLRRTSLDELPQVLNVLKGEMSLVGPRPPIPEEVAKYERWQRRRLSMKPGITCFWQISGRNQVNFEEWMEMDLKYIDNWSIKLDMQILLKTIPVVLLGKGAS